MRFGSVGTGQHEHVVVGYLLLSVGQLQELLVYLVQLLLIFHVNTVHFEPVFQCCPSAASRQNDGVIIESHILGVHYLVSLCIFQHAVLVNAA